MSGPPSRFEKEELVRLAANGSIAHLSDLCSYVRDHGDYDIDICAAVMHLLDPSHVPTFAVSTYLPTPWTGIPEGASKVAEHVVELLASICQGLTTPKLKASAAGLFKKHHHIVFQWLQALIKEGKLVGASGRLMLAMSSLHADLEQAIMTSKTDVELIFAAWMRKDSDGKYVVVTDCDVCPLLNLLQKVAQHELGKILLWDMLMSSPSKAKELARTTIDRIHDIAEQRSHSQLSSVFALTYLRVLLDIISQLLKEQTHCWEIFFRSGSFLITLSQALLTIARSQIEAKALEDLEKCLRHIVAFCLTGRMGTINPVHQVCNALRGGTMTLLYRCLVKLPHSDPIFSFTLLALGDLCAYAIYSPVIPRLISAQTQSISASMLQSLSSRSIELPGLISTIDATVFMATVLHATDGGRRTGTRICDNLDHRWSSPMPLRGDLAKQCSRCRAVFYCSSECQRTDWKELHRSECEAEASRYIQQRDLGISLSALLRFQLFAYIEAFCKRHFPVFESIRRDKCSTLPLHSLVVFVDHVSIPPGIDVVTRSIYNKGLADGCLVHQKRRADRYLRASEMSEIYLMEMIFPYGPSTVWVFARVWRDKNDTFRVLSTMNRMINVDEKVDGMGKTVREIHDYQAADLLYVD